MSLRQSINDDLKSAMKAGEKLRVSTLRLMNAAIKDKDILGRTEGHDSALTSDAGLIDLFAKMVKQRQESVAVFETARPEMAEAERAEIAIIQGYMPKQLAEDEVKAVITAAIAATGAAGMKDMGKVVASLKASHAGQMDFAKASAMVKALLAG